MKFGTGPHHLHDFDSFSLSQQCRSTSTFRPPPASAPGFRGSGSVCSALILNGFFDEQPWLELPHSCDTILLTSRSCAEADQTDRLIRVCSRSPGLNSQDCCFCFFVFFFVRPFLQSSASRCAAPCSLLMNLSAEVFLETAVMQVAPVM